MKIRFSIIVIVVIGMLSPSILYAQEIETTIDIDALGKLQKLKMLWFYQGINK
jgi:hypothetical protein